MYMWLCSHLVLSPSPALPSVVASCSIPGLKCWWNYPAQANCRHCYESRMTQTFAGCFAPQPCGSASAQSRVGLAHGSTGLRAKIVREARSPESAWTGKGLCMMHDASGCRQEATIIRFWKTPTLTGQPHLMY
jgi:hypothetical protein